MAIAPASDVPRCWVEKIMGKSDDSSKLGREPQMRELRDDELDGVTGGLVVIPIIMTLVGLLLPAVNSEG
jgi:hypothetical protein